MSAHSRLAALVIAQDEEARLPGCLASLTFCDERIVVDGGSKDRTREVAAEQGARVVTRPFDDFAKQHAFALAQTGADWVLSLDADERVPPALAAEIAAALARAEENSLTSAFSIPFLNHFRGVPLRHGGLWPDRHVRLFRRARARYDAAREVHEKLQIDGPVAELREPIHHFGWTSFAQALAKSSRYAELGARQLHARGVRGSLFRVFAKPAWRLLRGYVLQLGFLDGVPGFLIAELRSREAFQREMRLWELGRFADSAPDRLR